MEAYTDFAYVYDVFMDNTPYDKWGGLLVSRLEKEGITDGILLDLSLIHITLPTKLEV